MLTRVNSTNIIILLIMIINKIFLYNENHLL